MSRCIMSFTWPCKVHAMLEATSMSAYLLQRGLILKCLLVGAEKDRGFRVPQASYVQVEGTAGEAVRVSGQEEGGQDGFPGICPGNHHWQAASILDIVNILFEIFSHSRISLRSDYVSFIGIMFCPCEWHSTLTAFNGLTQNFPASSSHAVHLIRTVDDPTPLHMFHQVVTWYPVLSAAIMRHRSEQTTGHKRKLAVLKTWHLINFRKCLHNFTAAAQAANGSNLTT